MKIWPLEKLDSLCEVFTDGNWIESKNQSREGIRLIQTGNIGEGEFKDRRDKARFISENTFNERNYSPGKKVLDTILVH